MTGQHMLPTSQQQQQLVTWPAVQSSPWVPQQQLQMQVHPQLLLHPQQQQQQQLMSMPAPSPWVPQQLPPPGVMADAYQPLMQPGNLYQPAQAAFAPNGQLQLLAALQGEPQLPVVNVQLVTAMAAMVTEQLKGQLGSAPGSRGHSSS